MDTIQPYHVAFILMLITLWWQGAIVSPVSYTPAGIIQGWKNDKVKGRKGHINWVSSFALSPS